MSSNSCPITPRSRGSLLEPRNFAEIALIVACAMIFLDPWIVSGPPFGVDYPYHFNNMKAFTDQFIQGELYPKGLTGLWDGPVARISPSIPRSPTGLAAFDGWRCAGRAELATEVARFV